MKRILLAWAVLMAARGLCMADGSGIEVSPESAIGEATNGIPETNALLRVDVDGQMGPSNALFVARNGDTMSGSLQLGTNSVAADSDSPVLRWYSRSNSGTVTYDMFSDSLGEDNADLTITNQAGEVVLSYAQGNATWYMSNVVVRSTITAGTIDGTQTGNGVGLTNEWAIYALCGPLATGCVEVCEVAESFELSQILGKTDAGALTFMVGYAAFEDATGAYSTNLSTGTGATTCDVFTAFDVSLVPSGSVLVVDILTESTGNGTISVKGRTTQ